MIITALESPAGVNNVPRKGPSGPGASTSLDEGDSAGGCAEAGDAERAATSSPPMTDFRSRRAIACLLRVLIWYLGKYQINSPCQAGNRYRADHSAAASS
jgi:hypothetical protein